MSIHFNWSLLDGKVGESLVMYLNEYFGTLEGIPDSLGKIKVTGVDFGTTPPTVDIIDIRDPFSEFEQNFDSQDLQESSPSQFTRSHSPYHTRHQASAAPPQWPSSTELASNESDDFVVHSPAHPPLISPTAEWNETFQRRNAASNFTHFQIHLQAAYSGCMRIFISTELKFNLPSTSFISLPMDLKISILSFSGMRLCVRVANL